jgi:Phage integrase family
MMASGPCSARNVQEARPVEQAEAVDQAGGAIAEHGHPLEAIAGHRVGQGVLGGGRVGVGDPEAVGMVAVAALLGDQLGEAAGMVGGDLARYTARSAEAFVFLSSQGTHLRRSNFNRRVWQPATRAAGVEGLRHTAGTLATAAGGSLREVMDRLGHSITVAAVRYQHVMADRDAAIARELNRLIEGT